MAEHPAGERTGTAHHAKMYQLIPQKPRLSMIWIIDPETGKPTARWVTEQTTPSTAPVTAAA